MKPLTHALVVCLLAGSLAGVGHSQTLCDFKSITEYQRYDSDGHWIVFVIPAKLKRECLISFAGKVHADQPVTRLEFFDAQGSDLDAYIRSAAHGLDAAYFYPEKWLKKHHVASLYVFPAGRGPSDCDWTLKFEKKGDEVLIGRGPCH